MSDFGQKTGQIGTKLDKTVTFYDPTMRLTHFGLKSDEQKFNVFYLIFKKPKICSI